MYLPSTSLDSLGSVDPHPVQCSPELGVVLFNLTWLRSGNDVEQKTTVMLRLGDIEVPFLPSGQLSKKTTTPLRPTCP
jgi:hypothetical protein